MDYQYLAPLLFILSTSKASCARLHSFNGLHFYFVSRTTAIASDGLLAPYKAEHYTTQQLRAAALLVRWYAGTMYKQHSSTCIKKRKLKPSAKKLPRNLLGRQHAVFRCAPQRYAALSQSTQGQHTSFFRGLLSPLLIIAVYYRRQCAKITNPAITHITPVVNKRLTR